MLRKKIKKKTLENSLIDGVFRSQEEKIKKSGKVFSNISILRVEKDIAVKKWGHRQCWGPHFCRHQKVYMKLFGNCGCLNFYTSCFSLSILCAFLPVFSLFPPPCSHSPTLCLGHLSYPMPQCCDSFFFLF